MAQEIGRPNVLVVDDDPVTRQLLRLHLQNAGYHVRLAEDAIVAGHAVLKAAPDLVLLDVQMPYMDGYEFAAALKADPTTAATPIVFLTSHDDVDDRAKKLGAAAYLKKPLTADRLLAVVALLAERAS